MHFRTLILCFFFFIIGHLFTIAQITLSGTVVDINKEPIPFSNIILTHPDTGILIVGTVTDIAGKFEINVTEETSVQVTISYVGFESWTSLVNRSTDLKNIVLNQNTNNLAEVFLTGTKQAITRKKDQLIFNIQNTPLKTGYDGIEVLKVTPYVWVDSNNAITMRDDQARILINGRRINMSGSELSNYISNINSENILRIEVQTNQSANSSAESTGGLINIILKEEPKGIRAQFKTYYANRGNGYEIGYGGFTASYGSEKWKIYGRFNNTRNETFNVINNGVSFLESVRANTTLRKKEQVISRQNYQLGVVTTINKYHDIGVEFFGTHSNQEYDDLGSISYFDNQGLIDGGRNDNIGVAKSDRLNGVLNYKWIIGEQDNLTVFVDYLKSENEGNSIVDNVYENGTLDDNQNRYTSDAKTEVYAFQADYEKFFKGDLDLNFGIKYTASDRFNSLLSEIRSDMIFITNSEETTDFNYKEDVGAFYVQGSKTYQENNFFKLGLRAENTVLEKTDFITGSIINQEYINWFPSLYYSRVLDEKKSISISYSRSLRRPSFRDLSDNITKVNDFQFILGNPDLNPEFVSQYEVNYDFNQSGISAYYKNVDDAINGIYFIEEDVAFYKKFNSGSQVQYGLQFNSSKKIKNWWFARFSSHLYNRKFVNENGASSFEKVTIGARLFNTFTLNKTMSIDLSTRYTSPRADAFYEAESIYTTNVTFKKSFFKKKLNVRVYLDDIFDNLRYKNVRQFETFSTSADNKPRSRKIMLWLTYDLSNTKKITSKINKSKNSSTNRL